MFFAPGMRSGGRSMIESYEAGTASSFELYGLGFEHKHVPETQRYSGLTRRPIFVPSVGNYRQGMLVSVPLHLDTLLGKPSGADLHAALAKRYAGSKYVSVMPLENAATKGQIVIGVYEVDQAIFADPTGLGPYELTEKAQAEGYDIGEAYRA